MATDAVDEAVKAPRETENISLFFALVCCLLSLSVVWTTLSDHAVSHWVSGSMFLIFCLAGLMRFGLREKALMIIAVIVTVFAVWRLGSDAWPLVLEDLSRGAYLAAFMMLLACLREGAFRSRSVLKIGHYLTNQPPGRRYLALHVGGHFIGVLLNFSAISLLGPLILRGAQAAHSPDSPRALYDIRLRRQISALSRGFSWFNLWAPTAISQAVVLTTVPGSRASIIAPLGLAIAFIMMWAGWAEDRMTGYRARMRLARDGFKLSSREAPPFPGTALLRFLAVAAGLLGLAFLIYAVSDILFVSAIMIAALPLTVLWLTVQTFTDSHRTVRELRDEVRRLLRFAIPSGSPEAATLGVAGYIGLLAASIASHSAFAEALALEGFSPAAVYVAVSAFIPLASCIGLPPIMIVTFIGGILVAMPQLGLNPSMLGLALLVGWALNLTGSPFSATSLLLSRVVGIPGPVHAWRWNGLFTLMSWVVGALVLTAAAGWIG
ncbi:MAG: hypothetical protein AAF724_10145 [Pseudomonadota bacterium]